MIKILRDTVWIWFAISILSDGPCVADEALGDGKKPAVTVSEGSSSVHVSPPIVPDAPITIPDGSSELAGTPMPVDPPAPVVTVRVRVPAQSPVGEEICYRICVENCSSAAAHHVCVRATLSNNVEVVRASLKPHHKKRELTWGLGTLSPGASQEMALVLRPLGGTDVKLCARVQFEHGQCVTTRLSGFAPEVAPTPTPVSPPEIIPVQPPDKMPPDSKPPVVPPPDKKIVPPDKKPPTGKPSQLQLTMDGPRRQYVNLPTTYRITVRNNGPGASTNLAITNDIPEDAEYVSSTPNAVVHAGRAVWLLGNLESGQSRSVEIELRAKEAGKICNKASAIDDWQREVRAEWCTLFEGISALMFEMTDTKDPVLVGIETSYYIVVRNQGSEPVTNIRIRALLPKLLQVTRARGPTDNRRAKPTPDGEDVIEFDALARLMPGKQVAYEVFAKGVAPGDARFAVEMIADQLTAGVPVREEESTMIFAENGLESKEPPR